MLKKGVEEEISWGKYVIGDEIRGGKKESLESITTPKAKISSYLSAVIICEYIAIHIKHITA